MNDILLYSFAVILVITSPHPGLLLVLAAVLFPALWIRFWIMEGTVKRKTLRRLQRRF